MKIISSGRGIHSPEFYKKKQKARRIRWVVSIIIILILAVLAVYFFRWERFIISEVAVADVIAVDREEIKNVVDAEIRGYYLFVIPKANAFIYRKSFIKERLLKEFPRFKSLELDLRGFKQIFISGEERKPFALYCATECFFLDNEGLIFALAPSFSDGVYFIYKMENPLENPLGQKLLSDLEFGSMVNFIESISTLGVSAVSLEISEDDYRLFLSGGGEIVWRTDVDLNLIYSNLEAFLTDEAIKSQIDFLDKIEYLDLRTENKVFYRFR